MLLIRRLVPLFFYPKIYPQSFNAPRRTFQYLSILGGVSYDKLIKLFQSRTIVDKEHINVRKVIFEKVDVIVDMDELVECNQNIGNNVTFWPIFINYTIANKFSDVSNSLGDYFLVHKDSHTNNTLYCVLRLLRKLDRFEDFRKLYDFILNRLDKNERKILFPSMINELGRTPYWRQSLNYFHLLEVTNALPYQTLFKSVLHYESSDEIIKFIETYSKFLDNFNNGHFHILCNRLNSIGPVEMIKIFDQLLKVLQIHQIVLNADCVHEIENLFNKLDQWSLKSGIYIESDRRCLNCKNQLPALDLSMFCFPQMARQFYNQADNREDFLLNTSVKELEYVDHFLSVNNKPFDCIIDLLNICVPFAKKDVYWRNAIHGFFFNLRDFYNISRICMVGRGSFKLKQNDVTELRKKHGIHLAYLDIAQDSKDDLFTLYLAMRSGPQCYVLSSDLFRQHKFIAGSTLEKQIKKWLNVRQIMLDLSTPKKFVDPYPCIPQVYGDADKGWHIPYEYERQNNNSIIKWLCLKREN